MVLDKIKSWDQIEHFYTVVIEDSFNKAAEQLNISLSSLSQSIAGLEKELDEALFIPQSPRLILTRMGECYFCIARNMASSINKMKTMFEEDKQNNEGLTLGVPFGFSHTSLLPKLVSFLKLYPQIDLIFEYEDKRPQSKSARESVADAYIKKGEGSDSKLNHTYLNSQVDCLYARQSYLEKYGLPSGAQDLKDHVLLALDNSSNHLSKDKADWILQVGKEREDSYSKERLHFTNIEHLYHAATEGIGIVSLPNDSLLLESGEFISVLPGLHSLETQTCLSYPKDRPKLGTIKTLEAYLINSYKALN